MAEATRGGAAVFEIDRDGVWLHEGVEVTHPGVVGNLYANLREEAGTYHLQVGPRRIPVAVADAPFVVARVELAPGPEAEVRICLSDGSIETLAPESLWLDGRGTPYCRVKGGRFPARLSLPAWLQLAALVEDGPAPGQATLVLGRRRLPLVRRS